MAYELEVLETGWRLGLHTLDWENLLSLAYRYGWRPMAGLDHYRYDGRDQVVPSSDARDLSEALSRALRHLPPERRKEFRPGGDIVGELETPQILPGADYERYFAWQRRWIVEEAIRLCERGAVRIRQF